MSLMPSLDYTAIVCCVGFESEQEVRNDEVYLSVVLNPTRATAKSFYTTLPSQTLNTRKARLQGKTREVERQNGTHLVYKKKQLPVAASLCCYWIVLECLHKWSSSLHTQVQCP